jgi:hypothetical protein
MQAIVTADAGIGSMPKPEQSLLYTFIVAVMLLAVVAAAHLCVNALWRCARVLFILALVSAALILAVGACVGVDVWMCGLRMRGCVSPLFGCACAHGALTH